MRATLAAGFFATPAFGAATAVVLSERVALADGFFGAATAVVGVVADLPVVVAPGWAVPACAGVPVFALVTVAAGAGVFVVVTCAVVVCGPAVCERPGAAEAASSARLSVHARGIASRLEIGRPLMSPPPLRLRREGGSGR
jgi:hypothetical protein